MCNLCVENLCEIIQDLQASIDELEEGTRDTERICQAAEDEIWAEVTGGDSTDIARNWG